MYAPNPRSERTVVEGIQMTGLKGPKIIQFAEDMQFTPNLYENTVVIFG
jgi:hypothetical protein